MAAGVSEKRGGKGREGKPHTKYMRHTHAHIHAHTGRCQTKNTEKDFWEEETGTQERETQPRKPNTVPFPSRRSTFKKISGEHLRLGRRKKKRSRGDLLGCGGGKWVVSTVLYVT